MALTDRSGQRFTQALPRLSPPSCPHPERGRALPPAGPCVQPLPRQGSALPVRLHRTLLPARSGEGIVAQLVPCGHLPSQRPLPTSSGAEESGQDRVPGRDPCRSRFTAGTVGLESHRAGSGVDRCAGPRAVPPSRHHEGSCSLSIPSAGAGQGLTPPTEPGLRK